MDKKSSLEEEPVLSELEKKIKIIMRQTDYSKEQALQKLYECENDEVLVIKCYLGISVKKPDEPVKSVNQEIYKQLRYRLDSSMRNYHERVEKGEAKKI
jgi:hypothetical protein